MPDETNPEGEPREGAEIPQTPEEPKEATSERTKDSEIKANVKFWKDLGIEVDEADVKAKIESIPEKEGFNWYFYFPEMDSDSMNKILGKILVSSDLNLVIDVDRVNYLSQISHKRSSKKESYAIVAHYQQEPDVDSLGEKKRDYRFKYPQGEFMTFAELIVAEGRWHSEDASHLNEKNATLCPQSKMTYLPSLHSEGFREDRGAPIVSFFSGYKDLIMVDTSLRGTWAANASGALVNQPYVGWRRVFTSEKK